MRTNPYRKQTLMVGAAILALLVFAAGAAAMVYNNNLPKDKTKVVVTTQKENINWNDTPPQPVAQQLPPCNDDNIVGKVVGGVAGGLIGNEIGDGKGKTVATIGGAVGGTILGEEYIPTQNVTCR